MSSSSSLSAISISSVGDYYGEYCFHSNFLGGIFHRGDFRFPSPEFIKVPCIFDKDENCSDSFPGKLDPKSSASASAQCPALINMYLNCIFFFIY